jgi:exodeoxyribonuclease-1
MKTFFFYDLETSGLNPREDRIMQFAGQRTGMDLNPIGDPVNILVKLNDDTLPSPEAILVTKITPQSTLQDGLSEAEFVKYLQSEIFTEDTIATGYNSVRFDDEFMRYLFWRNFYDPYEWSWKEGRSRWDLLDVVRMARALRPEGINWPFDKDGKPTNRLELLTKLNNISHEAAHDALSDVTALIEVTKLIKTKQPKLFDYLLNLRDKKAVAEVVNLDNKRPFVYSSGRYPSEFNKTTVAFPLTAGKNGNIVVFDLRYNLDDILNQKYENITEEKGYYPVIKKLALNRCPAVAPLPVLDQDDGWQKINLTPEQIEENKKSLLNHPEFAEKVRSDFEQDREFEPNPDPEGKLYDAFLPDIDRYKLEQVRNASANELADLSPIFVDERLPELLIHYKARNFPDSLNEPEEEKWEQYRKSRIERQSVNFLKSLGTLTQDPKTDKYILEELKLYFESLATFE